MPMLLHDKTTPSHFPISFLGTVSARRARLTVNNKAEAKPWMTRPRNSTHGASPNP